MAPFVHVWTHVPRGTQEIVKHDLQSRINTFVKRNLTGVPGMVGNRVEIEFVDDTDITRESFLRGDAVILRMRRDDPEDHNFVRGAYQFVSTSLLYKAKRYISPSQRDAIDLFVTHQLLRKEKPHVIGYFTETYLHEMLDQDPRKMGYFDSFAIIHERGQFYTIFLQELDFLGTKVFGGAVTTVS
jgi:hypothetical protein